MALSPNQKLLFEYKEGKIGWEAFKQQFVAQLRNDMDCLEAIHALHSMSGSEDVTLLCYEKSGNPCHRHLVRDIVENPNLLTPQP